MIEVLYFARLREVLGCANERLALPGGVDNVAKLRDWLRERGGSWAAELAAGKALRVAVNQSMAQAETPIRDGDEVAFFPPVTGG